MFLPPSVVNLHALLTKTPLIVDKKKQLINEHFDHNTNCATSDSGTSNSIPRETEAVTVHEVTRVDQKMERATRVVFLCDIYFFFQVFFLVFFVLLKRNILSFVTWFSMLIAVKLG